MMGKGGLHDFTVLLEVSEVVIAQPGISPHGQRAATRLEARDFVSGRVDVDEAGRFHAGEDQSDGELPECFTIEFVAFAFAVDQVVLLVRSDPDSDLFVLVAMGAMIGTGRDCEEAPGIAGVDSPHAAVTGVAPMIPVFSVEGPGFVRFCQQVLHLLWIPWFT